MQRLVIGHQVDLHVTGRGCHHMTMHARKTCIPRTGALSLEPEPLPADITPPVTGSNGNARGSSSSGAPEREAALVVATRSRSLSSPGAAGVGRRWRDGTGLPRERGRRRAHVVGRRARAAARLPRRDGRTGTGEPGRIRDRPRRRRAHAARVRADAVPPAGGTRAVPGDGGVRARAPRTSRVARAPAASAHHDRIVLVRARTRTRTGGCGDRAPELVALAGVRARPRGTDRDRSRVERDQRVARVRAIAADDRGSRRARRPDRHGALSRRVSRSRSRAGGRSCSP